VSERCELCGRPEVELTDHHLVPRSQHRRLRRRNPAFDVAAAREAVARLCRPCHKTVHAVLDERELAENYASVADLRQHPEIARFVSWVRRQEPGKRIVVRRPRSEGH
jgi:hypothetical protein